jgi:hypothetical protein
LLAPFSAGVAANAPDVRSPVPDTQFKRPIFSALFERNHHFSICRLSCNGTSIPFAGSDFIRDAGHCTCKRCGVNKAMAMPVANVKNRFVLARKMVYSFPQR